MYRKILAAVNEHLNSEVAARYSMELARVTGSKLYICHVAEKGAPIKSLQLAEEAAKRLFHRAREMDVEAESIFDSGNPVRRIGDIVTSEGIDIVFVATRREDVERRFYSGTVARKLCVVLPCSVALVRVVHLGRLHPRKILVPLKARIYHISEHSYFTAMMATAFDSCVYLFHTTRPITKFFHGELHLSPLELEYGQPKDLARFSECLEKYNVVHEKRLVSGTAGNNIAVEAAAKRFDLVIMGASERGLLHSLLKGNPVEDVLRETPCDLIILKPGHEDQQSSNR
jgi:nucleotide-binding universal stress UspA family protein